MKKYILAATAILLMVRLSCAVDYVANMNGKLKVISGNNVTDITAPVILTDGMKVLTDGTVISKSGQTGKLALNTVAGGGGQWRGLHSFYGLPLVVDPLRHTITVSGLKSLSSLLTAQESGNGTIKGK